MSDRVVLDTSVLVALVDSRDKWHSVAIAIRDALKTRRIGLIYLDPVINETVSVLARRLQEQRRAESFGGLLDIIEDLAPPERITWVSAMTQRLYPQVIALVREHDGALNFHDALIALACRELGFQDIASFDGGFDHVAWLYRLGSPRDVESLAQQ
jgi:predicted nucleic acid-binding protein